MILLISIGVFLTLSTLTLLIYQMTTAEKRVVSSRLDQVALGSLSMDSKSLTYQEESPVGLR